MKVINWIIRMLKYIFLMPIVWLLSKKMKE